MKRRSFLNGTLATVASGALKSVIFLPSLLQTPTPPSAQGGTIRFGCDIAESAMIAFYVGGPCTFTYQWGYLDYGRYLRQPHFDPLPDSGEVVLWFVNSGYQQVQDFSWYATAPAWYTFGTCV